MRTTYRIATTLVALGAVFPFGAVAAHADTAVALVDQTNWFWAEQVGGTVPNTPLPYPSGIPDATVPQDSNDLAVAGNPAQTQKEPKGVDKEAYLSFSFTTVPALSTVNTFTFTMPLDPAANGSAYDPQTPPVLIACAASGGWGQGNIGQHGDQFDGKPSDDCAGAPKGTFDATKKTYTFDITATAQKWVNGDINFGIGIRNADTYTTPFNLVFGPVEKITASVDYTPPAPVVTPTVAPPPPVDQPVVQPPVSGGYGSGTVTPPVVNQPSAPAPQAPPVAPPVVAQPVTQVAARPLSQESGVPAAFWFAMLAAVVLLGAVSLVLGDPDVTVTGNRQRGLDRALRRRAAGAAGTTGLRPRTV